MFHGVPLTGGGEVYRVEPADPYPHSHAETIERYDTVLLGSPIWNVLAPMIMNSFTDGLAVRGEQVNDAAAEAQAVCTEIITSGQH